MKKYCLSLLIVVMMALSCVGCKTVRNADGGATNGENQVVENNNQENNGQNSQENNDAVDENENSNENVDEGTQDENQGAEQENQPTEDKTNEAYKPEYLETVSIDNMEELDEKLNELEKYNHGYFVSYNPETREIVFNVQKMTSVKPEDDPEEKYPNGYKLEELGEKTFILQEDCEMWLFVEGSSYLEYGMVSLEELSEMIESGYTEYILMIIYKDGDGVSCLMQQYLP